MIESVKDIKATPSFYGLEESIRKCSNKSPYFDCTSKIFQQNSLKHCGCVPENINVEAKVTIQIMIVHWYNQCYS